MNEKTKKLVLCAMFAALTGVLSQISIPLPFTPVPINLATLSACLAGGLLGAKYGFISQVVYILLGAVGIPVFSGFSSGVGILVGPTGGYIIGYALQAFIIGSIVKNKKNNIPVLVGSMILGIMGCYLLGTIWFMSITKTGLIEALMLCVVPFLIGDAIKIATGSVLVKKLGNYI